MRTLTELRSGLAALSLAAVAVVPIPCGANDTVPVWVEYVDCAKNAGNVSQPSIDAIEWSGRLALQQAWPATTMPISRDLSFSLPPGFYQIVVSNAGCGDSLFVTVLKDHPRHLVAVGYKGVVLRDARAMLSGTLPSTGWRVAIVFPDRDSLRGSGSDWTGHLEIPAVVEGSAYYATGLPDGHAIVRLYNQLRDRWFDFDAGQIDMRPPKAHSALIRNITEHDLESAAAQPKW
jgi:hypothetical protein